MISLYYINYDSNNRFSILRSHELSNFVGYLHKQNEVHLVKCSNSLYSQVGLLGEFLDLYKGEGLKSTKWVSTVNPPKQRPLTWYKVYLSLLLYDLNPNISFHFKASFQSDDLLA